MLQKRTLLLVVSVLSSRGWVWGKRNPNEITANGVLLPPLNPTTLHGLESITVMSSLPQNLVTERERQDITEDMEEEEAV